MGNHSAVLMHRVQFALLVGSVGVPLPAPLYNQPAQNRDHPVGGDDILDQCGDRKPLTIGNDGDGSRSSRYLVPKRSKQPTNCVQEYLRLDRPLYDGYKVRAEMPQIGRIPATRNACWKPTCNDNGQDWKL